MSQSETYQSGEQPGELSLGEQFNRLGLDDHERDQVLPGLAVLSSLRRIAEQRHNASQPSCASPQSEDFPQTA